MEAMHAAGWYVLYCMEGDRQTLMPHKQVIKPASGGAFWTQAPNKDRVSSTKPWSDYNTHWHPRQTHYASSTS